MEIHFGTNKNREFITSMSESQVMLKEILQIGGICSSQKLWKSLLHFPVKSNNLNVQNLILYKLRSVVQIVIQCSQLLLSSFRFVQGMCSQAWGWNCVCGWFEWIQFTEVFSGWFWCGPDTCGLGVRLWHAWIQTKT